eukprot:3032797-Karenia_brevis.AAC.1
MEVFFWIWCIFTVARCPPTAEIDQLQCSHLIIKSNVCIEAAACPAARLQKGRKHDQLQHSNFIGQSDKTHKLAVAPNMISFSAAISDCGFEMRDVDTQRNVISFSVATLAGK